MGKCPRMLSGKPIHKATAHEQLGIAAPVYDVVAETRNCKACGGPIDEHGICFECDKPADRQTVAALEAKIGLLQSMLASARAGDCPACEKRKLGNRDRQRRKRAISG